MSRYRWGYQESMICWTLWAFGFQVKNFRGWEMDELNIYFGPFKFVFLSSKQMEKVG